MDQQTVEYTGVILAAGYGSRLSAVTTAPKSMLRLAGGTLIGRHVQQLSAAGVKDIVVVVGYRQEVIREHLNSLSAAAEIRYVENEDYRRKGNAYSLYLGLQQARGAVLAMDGDLAYDAAILTEFLAGPAENRVLVGPGSPEDVECAKAFVDADGNITRLVDKRLAEPREDSFLGEAIGFLLFSEAGKQELLRCAEAFFQDPAHLPLNWEHLINRYVRSAPIAARYEPSDRWFEIDTPEDYEAARRKFGE